MGNSVILLDLSFIKSIIRRASHILNNLELLLDNTANQNSFVHMIIGDFNTRSKKFEGKKFEFLTSKCGFKQVISDQTHILESSSSCIYFIFTPQPNIVMKSGVHYSLHPNCYHQITHAKFNLKTLYHLHMKESFGNIKMQIMI